MINFNPAEFNLF